uniref:Uncharacterized protein n=1 Tax=Emiliania huxleyi (strain CCMP1516) TaxID=280463 RepID=A0A0D3JWP1_EMIH1
MPRTVSRARGSGRQRVAASDERPKKWSTPPPPAWAARCSCGRTRLRPPRCGAPRSATPSSRRSTRRAGSCASLTWTRSSSLPPRSRWRRARSPRPAWCAACASAGAAACSSPAATTRRCEPGTSLPTPRPRRSARGRTTRRLGASPSRLSRRAARPRSSASGPTSLEKCLPLTCAVRLRRRCSSSATSPPSRTSPSRPAAASCSVRAEKSQFTRP